MSSTTTISFAFAVGGVLTNVTSAVLADPTAAFGVQRRDTGATVVAVNTAMTHDGTGLYSYQFTDPAGGLVYRYWVKVVYNGATYYFEKERSGNPTGGMTLTEARGWVRQFARSAGDPTAYANEEIDRAILTVGERFCRTTRCLPRVDTVTLTIDDATVDLTGLDDTFAPERLVNVYASGVAEPLTVIEFDEMNRRAVTDGDDAVGGEPRALAFEDLTTAQVYPTPDAAYVLKFRWWEAFTTWVPGVSTGTADALYLNVRKDLLIQILPDGPVAVLQKNYPEHAAGAAARWQDYLATEQRLAGAGNLGAQVVTRRRIV